MNLINLLTNQNKLLVLGSGITGKSIIKFLKEYPVKIYLFDEKETHSDAINFSSLTDELKKLDFSLILKSPGFKPTHEVYKFFKEKKIPILSEIEFARSFFKGKIIGITGTDGKSTTTALTFHIIQNSFPKSKMGGNIGVPFVDFCKEDLDFAVLELSSYQLDDSQFLELDSSAFLNLAIDHLERHGTIENYREAKKKIINRTHKDSYFILNEKLIPSLELDQINSPTQKLVFGFSENRDAQIEPEKKQIKTKNFTYNTSQFPLSGLHNLENLAASILLSESVGCKPEKIQKAFEKFEGLNFRFQQVKKIENLEIINDSKSTNIHSLLSGISGIKEEKLILIIGGKQKGESILPLIERLKNLDVKVIIYGEAVEFWKEDLSQSLQENLFITKILDEAVKIAFDLTKKEKFEKIIFSPACASFDLYNNFEERGRHFNSLIQKYF